MPFQTASRVVDDVNDSAALPKGARTVSAQNDSVLSKALNEQGLTHVGKAIGRDHTFLSKFRAGDAKASWDEVVGMLNACGLRLISAGPDLVVMDRARLVAIVEIANIGMREVNDFAKYDE